MVPFKSTDWQSSSTQSEQPLRLQSSRMDNFSEEHVLLWVGLEEDKHSGIRRMSGVTSEGNNLHILTTYPLELHLPGRTIYTLLRRLTSPRYIRHELLSADMGWRLGYFSPTLLPYQGGAVIVLPELSMVLKLPFGNEGWGESSCVHVHYTGVGGIFRHQWWCTKQWR